MHELLLQAAESLTAPGLVAGDASLLVGALDEDVVWSQTPADLEQWRDVFAAAPGSALLKARPAGAYGVVTRQLALEAIRQGRAALCPSDSETRLFLHDIPIVPSLDPQAIAAALAKRKGCLVLDDEGAPLVVAIGSLTPGQAAVTISSILFACFVQFFVDALFLVRAHRLDRGAREALQAAARALPALPSKPPALQRGPFADEPSARAAMCEAGRATVQLGLVDSCFGNVSYAVDGVLYISQTGAALDALEDAIDACALTDDPVRGATTAGLTASSECSAHRAVIEQARNASPSPGAADVRAILHGHPRFAVILSMDCPGRTPGNAQPCPDADACQIRCPRSRSLEAAGCEDIAVVPGEVGVGPTGLVHTMPVALAGKRGAMVFGHGLFTADPVDFNGAMATLLEVERACRQEVLQRLGV